MKLKLNRLNEQVAFEIQNEEGLKVQVDGSASVGGEGLGIRPMELLASSLASCASIDVLLILKKKRIELTHFEVEILARRKDAVPASFESIHLIFQIGINDESDPVGKAVELSVKKYCSVATSLDKAIKISWEVVNKF